MNIDDLKMKRNVIPRWRPVGRSVQLGEACAAARKSEGAPLGERPSAGLVRAQAAFRRHRTAPYAAEVVAAAVVVGTPEDAREAARFLARHGEDLTVGNRMINRCLGRSTDPVAPVFIMNHAIHVFRNSGPYLREDGFAWLDLALAYASCGFYRKAERALIVARSLVGSTNRLVLRAEARLYQHMDMGNPERALATLRRDPDCLIADPWLMASEIGLSQHFGKRSRLVRRARAMIEKGDLPPFHFSELAAAVGTMEMEAGKHRVARKFFRLAVIEPADLGLAQTVWAAQKVDPKIHVPDRRVLKGSAEALALEALAQLQWRDAEKACKQWQFEEPFATTPAVALSSLLSMYLRDYKGAVQAAQDGLGANPNYSPLLNNRAFALAHLDRLDEAEADISKIEKLGIERHETNSICVDATKGLIAFRRDRPDEGECYYRRAMAMARNQRDRDLAARAGIYLIREAGLAGMDDLAQDPAVLNIVNAKSLTRATEQLRKDILESGWQRLRSLVTPDVTPRHF